MLIAQLLTRNSSELDRKHQQIDARQLSRTDQVRSYRETSVGWIVDPEGRPLSEKQLLAALADSDLIHIYGGGPTPLATRLPRPYLASFSPPPARWPWSQPRTPSFLIPATGRDSLPEAVDEAFFAGKRVEPSSATVVGAYVARASARRVAEQTIPRIGRLRDDVEWRFFEEPPSPADLRSLALWVDAAVAETDDDGFTAEAIVSGVPVVAARIPINEIRLERGTAGVLVRPGDSNELTHAVLSALFKPELMREREAIARQIAPRFHPDQRVSKLRALYGRVAS